MVEGNMPPSERTGLVRMRVAGIVPPPAPVEPPPPAPPPTEEPPLEAGVPPDAAAPPEPVVPPVLFTPPVLVAPPVPAELPPELVGAPPVPGVVGLLEEQPLPGAVRPMPTPNGRRRMNPMRRWRG